MEGGGRQVSWLDPRSAISIQPTETFEFLAVANFPSVESILLQLHKSSGMSASGGRTLKTDDKRDFGSLGLSLAKHEDIGVDILGDLFAQLGLDTQPQACEFATRHLMDFGNFFKAVELETWTFGASSRQVVWHVAGHVIAPSLGRYLALWACDETLDTGMPGGAFWFLPTIDESRGAVDLPVPKVLDWLLDLMAQSQADLKDHLGKLPDTKADSYIRTLHNWRKGSLPRPSAIHEMFADENDDRLPFAGTFELSGYESPNEALRSALQFVARKGLTAEQLRAQIPMGRPGLLESVLRGEAVAELQTHFIQLLLARYARPNAQVIRQRLLIARWCQDGYERLCQFLHPDVDASCTDISVNKVHQLVRILIRSYNLTIEAHSRGDGGEAAENDYFEAHLAPWERATLFRGVLPSKMRTADVAVGRALTRTLTEVVECSHLDDLIVVPTEMGPPAPPRPWLRFVRHSQEDQQVAELSARMKRTSPWRVLQAETSFAVVRQLRDQPGLNRGVRSVVMSRLAELASTPTQRMDVLLCELDDLMNVSAPGLNAENQRKVESLLTQAKTLPCFENWEAPVLSFEARHQLSQGRAKDALTTFKAALDACGKDSFGCLRAEIARDSWATVLATDTHLGPERREKFYRNMVAFGGFDGPTACIEKTEAVIAAYFWENLYRPYADATPLARPVRTV